MFTVDVKQQHNNLGIGINILFQSIIDFGISSDFKIRNVFGIHCLYLDMFIIASKMFSKTEDQNVHSLMTVKLRHIFNEFKLKIEVSRS